ncbi:MAG: hypothetical protein HY678_12380 [Chloroflexi bacterium]|nr:hypothetical protein [Chloroflexota bacterium]
MANKFKSTVLAGMTALVILTAACAGEEVATPGQGGSPTPVGAQPGIISGYDAVFFSLRGTGAEVLETDEEVEQPFFSIPGKLLKVNGQDVQVFEYRNVSAAEEEAKKVSPDGTKIGTSIVSWIGTPHFYRQANTIVLYVGDDASAIAALDKALGEQFAGGGNSAEHDDRSRTDRRRRR